MNESFSWLPLIFLSFSVFFLLSYALIFLYPTVKRRRMRRDLCVCDKWWSCLRPPSEYTYTAAWHMPIIEQAIREEKKMSDDKNEERCHLFSLSLFLSSLLWWRSSVPHTIYLCTIFYVSFIQSYNYMHRSTVNRFK